MFPSTTKGGRSIGFPDVCKVPAPAPPIPVPYPILSQTKKVKIGTASKRLALKRGSKYTRSSGDEAGVMRGLVSGKTINKAKGRPTSLVTNLMDYHHGQFIPRDSGIECQMPNCSNAAEAYLPKTGQPVCLQCYKTGTKGNYPTPSGKVNYVNLVV